MGIGKAKKIIKNIKSEDSYLENLKKPIKPNAFLLEAGQGKHINGNVFAFLRAIEQDTDYSLITPYLTVTEGNNSEIKEKLEQHGFNKTKTVIRNSSRYKEILATAKYLVTDNSFPTYMVKRTEQVYLNTWHGTPLKCLGRTDIKNATSIGNVQKNFLSADYILFPNTYTRDVMMKDYMIEKIYKGKIVLTDYPRNDVLFDEKKRRELRNVLGLDKKRVIAYMPTWRGSGRDADVEQQIDDAIKAIACIESNLKEDEVLYVNFHFLIGNNISIDRFEKTKFFPEEYETYDFLNACDVLITDYSSVMMDFAQTGREVIMYMYDYDNYMEQKGFYFDIRELPFPKAYDESQLSKAIHAENENYKLNNQFIGCDFGNATKKILQLLIYNETGNLKIASSKKSSEVKLVYVGNLEDEVARGQANQYLNSLDAEEAKKTIIAFESEIEGATLAFLQQLNNKIDFVRMPGKGLISNKEKVSFYLYRNYGLLKKQAKKYFKRENRRLFAFINCSNIELFSTDIYDRIGSICNADVKKGIHRLSLCFYNKLNDVYYYHPTSLNRTYENFDYLIEHHGSIVEQKNWRKYNGIHVTFETFKLILIGEHVVIKGLIKVLSSEKETSIGGTIRVGSTVYNNTIEYCIEQSEKRRTQRNGIYQIESDISFSVPIDDFNKWYSSNTVGIDVSIDGRNIIVPIRSKKNRNIFYKRVFDLNKGNLVCELKEDFKTLRIMIREKNVSDSALEKIKLYIAFVIHKLTPWNKPVILFEKQCSQYEESASVLFEKLIDDGYKRAKYILADDFAHKEKISSKYRKYIVKRFSLAHYYNMFACKSIISSESLDHALEKKCANRLFKKHILNGDKNYVFLQHGVMYMVSLSSEQRLFFRKSEGKGKQRVVVSSQLEANHFTESTNYTAKDIYNCGLLKFDKNEFDKNADRIVIMTTWRPWEFVNGKDNLKDTGYYRLLKTITECVPEELKNKVTVLPHPLIQEQAKDHYEDEVWKYYKTGIEYDKILRSAKVLVTDYSSIAYDAFYRGSSVVFCWKDKDECMKEYGQSAKLMLTEQLAFGDVCYEEKQMIEAILKAYNDSSRPKQYERNYSKIVEFHDGKNTERFIKMVSADKII